MNNAAEVFYRNPQDTIEVGDNLQKLREKRELSQEELGLMMDIKSTTISRYERGIREMGITTLVQFLVALNGSPYDLLPQRIQKSKTPNARKNRICYLLGKMSDEDAEMLISIAERLGK